VWAALLSLCCVAPRAALGEDRAPYTVDALTQHALLHDPALRALHAEWQAALARSEAARRALPQPRLSYTAYAMAVETRQGPQRHVVTLAQAFPWFGVLRNAALPELAHAEAIAASFDALALDRVYAIDLSAVALARLDALVTLLEEQRALYRDVADHDAAVMAFGAVEHGDLLRAELMVELLTDRIARAHADRERALLRLAELVGIATPFTVAVDPLPVAPISLPSEAGLLEAARASHPGFTELDARSRERLARAVVARDALRVSPTLSVSWAVVERYDMPLPNTGRGGRDALFFGVSLPLPVFRASAREHASAATWLAQASTEQEEAVDRRLVREIRDALARLQDENARLARYRDSLLPTARDATEHYAIRLARGTGTHTDYLLAFEQELALRTACVDAQAAIAAELARLRWLSASALDETPGVEATPNGGPSAIATPEHRP
jgi:outer membrane protein TolC